MTALDPSILAAVRRIVDAKWAACAEVQGIRTAGDVVVWAGGTISIRDSASPPFLRAAETLMRLVEDAGYDVERGTREGRPTWRVTGAATIPCPLCGGGGMCTRCAGSHGRVTIANLDAWDPARVRYDDALRADREKRDMPTQPDREAEKIRNYRRLQERAYGGRR